MTTVRTIWGPAAIGPITVWSDVLNTYALDDADDAIAGIICFPRDGTITHIGFFVAQITGTPPSYNCGLTTLDSSGQPTQTAYGGSTNTTAGSWSTGWKWIALAANATAGAGDFAAVHIWPTGTAPSTSNRIYVPNGCIGGGSYAAAFGTSWGFDDGAGLFAVKYDDGSIAGIALSTHTVASGITSATTPDEIGCVFTLPANMTVYGIRTASGGNGASAAYDFIIYNAAGTALATCSITDKDLLDNNPTIDAYFDAVTLTAGTTYRAVVKPTVGTNGQFYQQRYQFESAAAKAAWPHGDSSWQYTSRTDAGAWTDVSTDLMYIGLWVSDITFVQGSGSSGAEWGFVG